jgi:hypothetical protein
LLLSLLRFAQIKQESLLALTHLLGKLAQGGLPQTKRAKRLALLQAKLTILRAQSANAFADTAHKFLALKAQSTRLLRALHAHCGLRLTKLTRLTRKLACKLLTGQTSLPGRPRNLSLCLRTLQTKLTGLCGQLTRKLRGISCPFVPPAIPN